MSPDRDLGEYKKRGEILGQSGLWVVVADDNLADLNRTTEAVKEVLEGIGEGGKVEKAENVASLFKLAFGGEGRGADVVILDENYVKDHHSWKLEIDEFERLARERGFIGEGEGIEAKMKKGGDLNFLKIFLQKGEGVELACLLRILGFKGEIISVSNAPPEKGEILLTTEDMEKTFIGISLEENPFGGFALKKEFQGITFWSNYSGAELQMAGGGLAGALKAVFRNLGLGEEKKEGKWRGVSGMGN